MGRSMPNIIKISPKDFLLFTFSSIQIKEHSGKLACFLYNVLGTICDVHD